MKKLVSLLLVLALCMGICSALAEGYFDGERVRIVIGSTSTSGDSYLIAETFNQYFKKHTGANSKVDAVGANAALDTIATYKKDDGLTFMAFHDMTYLGVLFGAYDKDLYSLEKFVIGPRIGQNPGSAFAAKKDAPYNNIPEMADYVKANPDVTVRVAVEAGGVSQIGFVSFWAWIKENYGDDVANRVRIVVGGSTDVKLQMMWDGNADIIFADYSSLKQYTEEGVDAQLAVKFVGLLDKIADVEDLPVLGDVGVTLDGKPFYFSKDFVIYLPANTKAEVIAALDEAVAAIAADPDFQADMTKLTYVGNTLTSAEANDFIYAKRDSLAAVLEATPSFDELIAQ